jgi:hypothetical protein
VSLQRAASRARTNEFRRRDRVVVVAQQILQRAEALHDRFGIARLSPPHKVAK